MELANRPKAGTGKFTNQNLPLGCQDGNLWRGTYIPSLAHWCGGHVDPWTIEAGELHDAMQVIWDEVYRDSEVEHFITLKGAVFHVV